MSKKPKGATGIQDMADVEKAINYDHMGMQGKKNLDKIFGGLVNKDDSPADQDQPSDLR